MTLEVQKRSFVAVLSEHIIIIELMLIVILPSSLPLHLEDTQTCSYRIPRIMLVEAAVNEFIPPNPSSSTCRCRKPQVLFIFTIIVPLSQPKTTLQGVGISVRNERNMVLLNIRNGMQKNSFPYTYIQKSMPKRKFRNPLFLLIFRENK